MKLVPGLLEEKYYKVMVDFFNEQLSLARNKSK